jgi:hypothetical protein
VAVTRGRGGRPPRQAAGTRTTTPARSSAATSERRDVAEEPERLGGRPAQRVKELARVHHLAQPRAPLGGALDREEEREQPFAVARAGVLAQRLAERQVLRRAVGREAGRVGGEEGERRVRVARGLGEVEVHAADDVPRRMELLEQPFHREAARREPLGERRVDRAPKRRERVGRDVLAARHRRRAEGERGELGRVGWRWRVVRRRAGGTAGIGTVGVAVVGGVGGDTAHVAGAELPPVAKRRWERRTHLRAAELQESVAGAGAEGVGQAPGEGGVELRRVVVGDEQEVAVRGERGGEARWSHEEPGAIAGRPECSGAPAADGGCWRHVVPHSRVANETPRACPGNAAPSLVRKSRGLRAPRTGDGGGGRRVISIARVP